MCHNRMRDCAGYIWQYMAICPELQKQSMSMPALSISQAHGTSGCRFQTKRTGTNLYQPNPTLMEQLLRKDCFGSSLMADDLRTLLKEAKPGWSAQDNSDLSDSQTFLADPAGHFPIISPKYPKVIHETRTCRRSNASWPKLASKVPRNLDSVPVCPNENDQKGGWRNRPTIRPTSKNTHGQCEDWP